MTTFDDLRPETRALVEQVNANMPSQQTPEFTRLSERLLSIQACTSLSDKEATERVNRVPCGSTNGWQLSTDPKLAPVACADNPSTHRHVIFEC